MKLPWNIKLSETFFYLFLVSLSFNTRFIFSRETSFIDGTFSYPLGTFLYLSDICFMVFVLVWFCEQNRNKPQILAKVSHVYILLKSRYFWLTLAIVLISAISLLHVKHVSALNWYQFGKLLEFLLIISFIRSQYSKTLLYRSLFIIFLTGILQSLIGVGQFHVQHGFNLKFLGEYVAPLGTAGLATIDTISGKILRSYGTFPHPNVLGGFMVLALIAGYFNVSRETNYQAKLFLSLGNLLILWGIFTTFSRVAWFGAAFVSILWLIYTIRNKLNPRFIAVTIIVSCVTIFGLFYNLILTRIDGVTTSHAYLDRGTYNHFGIEILQDHLWLGTGPGNFIPTMRERFHLESWQYQPPHNIFIYLAANFGLIFIILFILLILQVFRSMWNSPRSTIRFALLTILLSILFISNFDHFFATIQQGQLIFATCLGFMFGFIKDSGEVITDS